MSQIDFSKIAKDLIVNSPEGTIDAYRVFYEKNLERIPARSGVVYRIYVFLNALERVPSPLVDHEFSKLTAEIRQYTEEVFDKPLLDWFNDKIPEVLQMQKESLFVFTLNEATRLQYRAKLMEIIERLNAFGLHQDIENRNPAQYARYNVVLEYRPEGSAKNKKECKKLMSLAELEQQILQPQRIQKPLQLNGKHFPPNEIKRFTITRTLLKNPEVRHYQAKHHCNTELSFCNSFPAVTDEMIQNPHLVDSSLTTIPTMPFIALSRIDELKAKTNSTWDFRKLIRLCEEINSSAQHENFFAVLFLLRALIDHVPPIFGQPSFEAVANNYAGPKSFKKAMDYLQKTLKPIADLHIHRQISATEPLPTLSQIDFKPKIETLLDQILRIA